MPESNVDQHIPRLIGDGVTPAELEDDPYPAFARLREGEPISWIAALNMWYLTRYEDVRAAILDPDRFTTSFEQSTIFDTFGSHMLTTEGVQHDRYRRATQGPFAPSCIRARFESAIAEAAGRLIEQFKHKKAVELRSAFAGRLPIQTILIVCGLPPSVEVQMRQWYDSFEHALANFIGDSTVRETAKSNVIGLHALLADAMTNAVGANEYSLLTTLVNAPPEERLSNEEIKRNLSIIFFGGISTVEALILNALWALFEHPAVFERVKADLTLLPQVLEETMRWLSPVQSATRHVIHGGVWHGVQFQAGDIVNCMLGAANRDPSVFPDPDRFDIDRPNVRRHLGFATGPHMCLGFNLAKAEVRISLEQLFTRLPNLTLVRRESEPPTGYEFRQPRRLTVQWSR